MKNWKTTLFGFGSGLALLLKNILAVLDNDSATNFDITEVSAALGLLGIGWFSKDKDVTGGTKPQ